VLVAYLIRTIAVSMLRDRRPEAAAAVDRWWVWAPFVVVLTFLLIAAIVLIVNSPILGLALTAALVAVLYFGFFSASSIGSPFRPRRR